MRSIDSSNATTAHLSTIARTAGVLRLDGGFYDDGLDDFERCSDCTILCSKCYDAVFSVNELNEQGICYNCRDSVVET